MRRIGVRALRALLFAGLLLVGAPASAEDSPRALVEWEADPMDPFLGQAVRLDLRVLLEERFLEENLVPFSLRPLDVPVQVEAAFLRDPRGLSPRGEAAAAAAGAATLALNGEAVRARRGPVEERGGRRYAVFTVERRFLAAAAGEVAAAAPVLRFEYAERFREDALGGRVPEERLEGSVEGSALHLVVHPLPAEGRPADFGGAVGRFTVSAALLEPDGAGAGAVRVALRIEGEGNLSSFEAPPFPGAAGLHLLGVRDDGGEPVRTVVYDLARGAGAAAVPSIRLPFLDPGPPAAWRIAETAALPLPAAPGLPAGEPAPPAEGVSGSDTVAGALRILLALLLPVVLVGFLLFRRRMRREEARFDPRAARAAAEALALRARLEEPGGDPGEVLVAVLAARLGGLPAAVISPDLRRRLEGAGASTDLAARTADLVDRLVSARYGGPPVEGALPAVRALLEEWGRGGKAGTFLTK